MYCEWLELFRKLTDEQAGKLIKHVFAYVNDENPEAPDVIIDIAFTSIKQQFKRDLKKYERRANTSRENGLKGGRPKKENPENPVGFLETQNNLKNLIKDKGKRIKDKGEGLNKNIEARKIEFYNSIPPFLSDQFTKQDAREFYEYWIEHGPRDKKMRFEKEKSFNVDRRIRTWIKNKSKFQPKNTAETPTKIKKINTL